MREVNESWHVLRDPGRRRRYDDDRLGRSRPTEPTGSSGGAGPPVPAEGDEDLVEVLPPMGAVTAGVVRHLPWMALLVVLVVIFVVTAYAGTDDPGTEAPPVVEVGSCLDLSPGPVTTVVPCEGPHDLRIVDRVREASACPAGSEARRLGDDATVDCVVAGDAPGR